MNWLDEQAKKIAQEREKRGLWTVDDLLTEGHVSMMPEVDPDEEHMKHVWRLYNKVGDSTTRSPGPS